MHAEVLIPWDFIVARRRSPTLTDGELPLMRVLWRRERATVADVVEALTERPRPAYNTVLTMLRILEEKGYVSHEKDGRAFVYQPRIGEQDARRNALGHLLGRLFDDSPSLLLLNLLEHQPVDADEIARLKRLIEEHEREAG
jgi:predicted transcriptional regulator